MLKSVVSRVALLVLWIVFIFFDAIFDDEMLNHSSEISLAMQDWGGRTLEVFGLLFTIFFAYIVFALIFFHFIWAKTQLQALYYFFVFGFAIMIGLWLKLIFYKGRPYVVNKGLKGSTCDPGMPSGHTIMSITGYYVVHQIITRELWPHSEDVRMPSKVICTMITILIMISRITLGDHSYNQVIMGALIALNVLANIDFDTFCNRLAKLPGRLKTVLLPIEVLNLVLLLVFNYFNHKYRERPDLWQFMNKNPSCQNTFIIGSAQSVPFNSFFVGGFLYYPYALVAPYKTGIASYHDTTFWQIVKRMGLHITVASPALLLLGTIFFITKTETIDVYYKSVYISILGSIMASYVALAMVNLSKRVLKACHLDRPEDYLNQAPPNHLEEREGILDGVEIAKKGVDDYKE